MLFSGVTINVTTFTGYEYNKSLKIPKGQSESVYRRRIDNTMAEFVYFSVFQIGLWNCSDGVICLFIITRLTRRVPLVEQELLTLSEQLRSRPVISSFFDWVQDTKFSRIFFIFFYMIGFIPQTIPKYSSYRF
jgi:hypothetical protein